MFTSGGVREQQLYSFRDIEIPKSANVFRNLLQRHQ